MSAEVGVHDYLADIVQLHCGASGSAGESAPWPHVDAGEHFDATGGRDRVKGGTGLRNQERRQDCPRNIVLRAVFMYIEHCTKPYKPGSELVAPAGLSL